MTDGEAVKPGAAKAAEWRCRMGMGAGAAAGGLESLNEGTRSAAPADRIAQARERMRELVMTDLGGDAALLESIDRLAISGEEAVAVLEAEEASPSLEQFSALEAVVAFDGSRPSFLLREDRIDFASSFSTGTWQTQLGPHLDDLRDFAACVGRVELSGRHIGTAFLVAPTLALTNRHVAQAIADVGVDPPELLGPAALDFGREHGAGRTTYDSREIKRVLLVGGQEISDGPVDHTKLDLALLEVGASTLAGAAGDRFLPISSRPGDLPAKWLAGAVGYPADWRVFVPASLRTQYDELLTRLLRGDAGTKRFAPGETSGMVDGTPRWSSTHDATTINGNSGSPMTVIRGGPLKVTGLHYGGRWSGERTNWAHVLSLCGDAACFPGGISLCASLKQHGISL